MLMAGLFLAAYEVTTAVGAIGDKVEQHDKWRVLADQLASQGMLGLKLLAGGAFAVWVFAIVDAARWGARLDRKAGAEKEKNRRRPGRRKPITLPLARQDALHPFR